MPRAQAFRVLVATDGSTPAKAAVTAAVRFPWPAGTRAQGVIAQRTPAEYRRSIQRAAIDRRTDLAAADSRLALSRRWPDAEVVVVDKTPVEGVLEAAERFGAKAIVLGWRGHGALRRLLMGSVSRGVARGARCAVLIVRHRPQEVRAIVIGVDGSATAQRAVMFVAGLMPPPGGRVTLFSAVEPKAVPLQGLAPGAIRATVAREIRRMNTRRARMAMKGLKRAAARLKRRGWQTRILMTTGEPLRDLLKAVDTEHAQLLVVGARGVSGVRYLLLGSVAEGALNRSSVPLLLVK